jgi:hypothetical protein
VDFTNEAGYTFAQTKDPLTGIATITIKSLDGLTSIGEIQIEPYKLRALTDSLAEIIKNFYPDTLKSNWRRRSIIMINQETASTEWSVP